MSEDQTFVIVGASLTGAKAAETLREEGFRGRVVLVGEEPERPYERPPLSKGYLKGTQPKEKAYVHEESWYADHAVELQLGAKATGIDLGTHTVTLDAGDQLRYDKLLLATGSAPRSLPVPGADDPDRVLYLRRMPDSDRIKAALKPDARIVIVGGGWIGLEVAAAARSAGAAVTLVEMAPLPLQLVLGDEVARIYADVHRANGVDLRLGQQVREIGRDAVVLDDGSELPADVVVAGVGAAPVTELAESAGLEVDNGVLVDEHLRTSDPDVYAAGDVANAYNPLYGTRIRVEHWANALNGGPAAARSMLGQDVVYDRVPYFYTDQFNLGMEYAGYVAPGGYDEVVFRGDVDRLEFISFWLADGRVRAGMNVNIWDVIGPIQALIRSGKQVDRARLADSDIPLDQL